MLSLFVAVALQASPLDPLPLVKTTEQPGHAAAEALLNMGFPLAGLGTTVAGTMGFALLMRGATRAGGCGIDVCAELGSDTPYVALLSAAIAAVVLIAWPMIFEGFREKFAD